LRKDLVEFTDFEIVSKKVFDVLQQWYGCDYIISSMFMPQPPQQPLVPQGTVSILDGRGFLFFFQMINHHKND
jgi:hypothetical protein